MRIAIMGCGKMGSWLAEVLAREGHEVSAYARDKSKAACLKGVNAIGGLQELSVLRPELFMNAVSLHNTIPAFESALQFLPMDCIICDVASVKGKLPEYYAKSGFKYASTHPMFGPTFANMKSLDGENAIIISESDQEAKEFFRDLFKKLGLNIFEYSFREHDEMMAYSLTTPFVSSLVFAACINKTVVPGSTFAKHLKIAKGLLSEDDHLLAEILFNDKSVQQISKITAKLEHMKHIIMAKDHAEAKAFLDRLRADIGG